MRPSLSPLGIFAGFLIGTEAVVGFVLSSSAGLSEMHKTVLVAFLTLFPILGILVFLPLTFRSRDTGPDVEAYAQGLAFRRSADILAE